MNCTPLQKAKWVRYSTFTLLKCLHDGGIWTRQTANYISMTHNHIQTHLQQARDNVKWTFNAWTSVLFTDESIVCVDFTDMPLRMWISPKKVFTILRRYSWSVWLGYAMAWEVVSIQENTDMHKVDNITQPAQWCRSLVDLYTLIWLCVIGATVSNIVEMFPNSLCRKPNPFWNLELMLGSCDIH